MDPRAHPRGLLPLLQGRYRSAIEQLEQLVNQDSGSWSAAGVNRVADLVSMRLRSAGWMVERSPHRPGPGQPLLGDMLIRSEEHTSELQSRPHLVCRLLLEKKKKKSKSLFMLKKQKKKKKNK